MNLRLMTGLGCVLSYIGALTVMRPKSVDHPIKGDVGKCRKCGGDLRDDLGPMCFKCKSRDIEEKEIICLYD